MVENNHVATLDDIVAEYRAKGTDIEFHYILEKNPEFRMRVTPSLALPVATVLQHLL